MAADAVAGCGYDVRGGTVAAVIEAVSGRVDLAAALAGLAQRHVNYDEADAPAPDRPGRWHLDEPRTLIAHEPAGPPVPGGPWDIACGLVRDYEFADPRIIRAVYRADSELLGRDMLLEGRFWGLRFYMGVRVTEVVDTCRGEERVWGLGYQTLEGHLEQGRLVYEVVKHADTGDIELVLRAYSRAAPIPNPAIRLGFKIFGRRTQLRFYREVGRRLRDAVQSAVDGRPTPQPARTAGGLVLAPSGVVPHRFEQLTIDRHQPGR